MAAEKRIALVTGANRGIGLETCRQLAKRGMHVVLTSRDEIKGEEAAKNLREEGLDVVYYQLSVTKAESIAQLNDFIRDRYGRLDVLVNNAGVQLEKTRNGGSPYPSVMEANLDMMRQTMDTNVYGPLMLCQVFVPLMEQTNYGRIVNVSSGMGQLTFISGGWPAYRMSKTALNALTRILSAELKGADILVNAVCPGWVRTDMGGPKATRSVEASVDTIIWAATLPKGGPTGGFFRDRQRIEW